MTAESELAVVPRGSGLETWRHDPPLQRKIRACKAERREYSPTAQALDADVPATPARPSRADLPPGSGHRARFHELPFQRAIMGCQLLPFQNWPTAHAFDREVAATLSSWLLADDPAGLGLATIFQTEPFQCSMRVRSQPVEVEYPTAQALDPDTTATADSWSLVIDRGAADPVHAGPAAATATARPAAKAAEATGRG